MFLIRSKQKCVFNQHLKEQFLFIVHTNDSDDKVT